MHGDRLHRPYGDAVEQAEPHGPVRLGVVAGRPERAHGVVGFTRHDRIDRCADRTRLAKRRFAGCRRHHRVGIDPHIAVIRHRFEDRFDEARIVHPLQLLARRLRRLPAEDVDEIPLLLLTLDRPVDHFGPRLLFRMPRSGVVGERGRVGVE